jgi:hypothetical protein
LAARSKASDLQGFLGLPFQVTPAMIIGIILGGGTDLPVGGGFGISPLPPQA